MLVFRSLLVLVLAAAAVGAYAAPPVPQAQPAGFTALAMGYQRLPAPGARYQDGDPAVDGAADPRWDPWNERQLEMARIIGERPGVGVREMTRHAYLLSLRGDRAGAEAGLAKARARFPEAVGLYWAEGWIRLNLLDFEGALVAWQQAERLHRGEPYWVPYSKAMALIGLGDDAAALAWWRVAQKRLAAVDTADGARARFHYWRHTEKLLLEELILLAYPGTPRKAVRVDAGFIDIVAAPQPEYPAAMLRQGLEGEVLLRFKVAADGVPQQVVVERSSGHPEFDSEALRAAQQARFSALPGTDGAWALVPYRFSLRNDDSTVK